MLLVPGKRVLPARCDRVGPDPKKIANLDWPTGRQSRRIPPAPVVPAQAYVGKFLATFREYPPRMKAASFSLDQVMEKLQAGGGSK